MHVTCSSLTVVPELAYSYWLDGSLLRSYTLSFVHVTKCSGYILAAFAVPVAGAAYLSPAGIAVFLSLPVPSSAEDAACCLGQNQNKLLVIMSQLYTQQLATACCRTLTCVYQKVGPCSMECSYQCINQTSLYIHPQHLVHAGDEVGVSL